MLAQKHLPCTHFNLNVPTLKWTCQALTFSTCLNPLTDISYPLSINSLHFHLFSKIYEFLTGQQITHPLTSPSGLSKTRWRWGQKMSTCFCVSIVRKSVNVCERQYLCIIVPVHDNVGMFCPQSNFFLFTFSHSEQHLCNLWFTVWEINWLKFCCRLS